MYQVMKWLFPRLNDSFKHWEDPGQFSVDWEDALEYGEYISMVHEAMDWDNMLVSFYPYFWDANAAGEQKPLLQHPDPEHREFLRAGAAKIILAIKPSYEEAVLSLLEQGEIGTLVEGHSFKAVIAQVSAEAEARRQSPDTIGEWETWTPTGALDIAVLLRKVQAE